MIYALLVVLGLCMGSFVEAGSWRLHERTSLKKLTARQKRDLSMTRGRSMCAHCRHQLSWYDLLPLVSWISLAGKCRYCRKPIGWQAPLLEVVTAGLFVVSYAWWPFLITSDPGVTWLLFAIWLVAVVLMVFLAVYDLRWMLLPDRMVAALLIVSLGYIVSREAFLGFETVTFLQICGSVLISSGIFWLLYQLSDGRWIGGGDVKLGVPLGILVSEPIRAALMLFVASLLGTVIGVVLIAQKRSRTTRIPFGPFLMAATVIVLLFGDGIIDWYLRITLGV